MIDDVGRLRLDMWSVRWERLNGNGDRECFGVTITTSDTTIMSLRGGTRGACRHVSTTLKSLMKLRKCVESDVYLESEASSPLYKRVLVITVSGLCGIWLGTKEDTCRVILVQRRASLWYGLFKLACSFRRRALRQGILCHVPTCDWSSDRSRTTC